MHSFVIVHSFHKLFEGVCIYVCVFFCLIQEGGPVICHNIDGLGGNYVIWNKPKIKTVHDLIYIWNLKDIYREKKREKEKDRERGREKENKKWLPGVEGGR